MTSGYGSTWDAKMGRKEEAMLNKEQAFDWLVKNECYIEEVHPDNFAVVDDGERIAWATTALEAVAKAAREQPSSHPAIVYAENLFAAHAALTAAGIPDGGCLSTRVGLLVERERESIGILLGVAGLEPHDRRAIDKAISILKGNQTT
jgi:hypothetical protein